MPTSSFALITLFIRLIRLKCYLSIESVWLACRTAAPMVFTSALLILRIFDLVQKVANTVGNELLLETSGFSSKAATIPGDVTIGMLLPLHRHCRDIWEQYGIHRTEMALKTIDEINHDKKLLPGIRLGIEIRDSCWAEKVAVEQTIEFIQDLLESRHAQQQQCCADGSTGEESCRPAAKHEGPLVAVIGPGNSANSKAVQNLLQIFRIPQIGYSATSTDLSNKEEFKYYMRVVPPDAFQAQVMVDIIRYFNWSYIGVVHSEGNYGEKGYDELTKRLKDYEENICVGFKEKIKTTGTNEDFDRLVQALKNVKQKPKVIICFCEGDAVKNIFKSITRFKALHPVNSSDIDFQWIGSESWADRSDVIEGSEEVAMGSLTIRIHSRRIEEFDRYFFQLNPATNIRNPWFQEFWEAKFNCSLANNSSPLRWRDRICTGEEDLSAQYDPDKKLAQVVNSIYTVAMALHQMHRDKCGTSLLGLCANMQPINGSELFYNYMMKVNFTKFEGMEVSYDPNGDPPARYDIMNYQRYNGSYGYVKVGDWATRFRQDESHLGIFFHNSVQFFNGNYSGNTDPPESVCSRPCGMGHAKKSQGNSRCCWACLPCKETEFLRDEWTCVSCEPGYWPTEDRTGCYELTVEYLRWTNIEAVIAACFAALGICAMAFTSVVFIIFNNTPVVKSTTRELSYIILVGIFLCYAATFVIIQRPTQVTCYLLRIGPGVAFAMMYGALLTKTNRIARILAGSKKRILTKKPRFLTTTAQLVITALLVGLELSIITAMLIYEPPDIRYDYSRARRVLLLCNTTSLGILAPLGFDFFLICLCTLYAVKTRSLPQNFNEAKFIGFTMYTTCIIWLAFLTIYFGSDSQSITMCFSFSLSATVALILLFFPKLYIILFKPQQNVRSSYATTKEIRIHYGTTPSTTHESLRYQNRSNPSTKVSSRSSTKQSRASSCDADSNFKTRRNFRESVHVPAVPKAGGIEADGNSDEILAPRSQPVVDFARRSVRHKYFPSQQDFKELSVIEESLVSHDDSHPTSQDKSASDRRDLGVQTDPELLTQLLAQVGRSPPSGIVRSRSQRFREGQQSTAKRSLSEYRSRSGRKKSLSPTATASDRSDLSSLVAVRLQQYDRGGNGRQDESLSPGASPLLPRTHSDSSRSNSVDRSDNNSDMEGMSQSQSRTSRVALVTEGNSLLPMTTEIVDLAEIYAEASRPRLIHNSIESSLNPLLSTAITSSSSEILSQKSADESPQVSRSKSTGFISRLRYSLRAKFGGSEHKNIRKTTVANPGALDPEFVQQMVESHERSLVTSKSEAQLESTRSPARHQLNGKEKAESCHDGIKSLPIAEETEEMMLSNRDSFDVNGSSTGESLTDSPRSGTANGEARRFSELLRAGGVEVDLTNSTLV